MQYGDAVADHLDFSKKMRADKNRLTIVAGTQQQLSYSDTYQRIKGRGRFIEDEQFRIVNQRLGQPYTLQHAAREFAQVAIGSLFQVEELKHFAHALTQDRIAHTIECTIGSNDTTRSNMIEGKVFRQKSYAAACGSVAEVLAQHASSTSGRTNEP